MWLMGVEVFSLYDTQAVHNGNPYKYFRNQHIHILSRNSCGRKLGVILRKKLERTNFCILLNFCCFKYENSCLPILPCHFFQAMNEFLVNRSFLKILLVMSRLDKICFKNTCKQHFCYQTPTSFHYAPQGSGI